MRFRFLLIAILLLVLVSPFLDDSILHRSYLVGLFALVMLAAILIASDQPRHRLLALAIGVPWLVLSLFGLAWDLFALAVHVYVLQTLFSVYVLYLVLMNIINAVEVDENILLGAASVYLLIALTWAGSFMIIHELDPDSFSLVHGEGRPYFHQFLYFSLTTLTTVGYGDITPLGPFAQIWATMEAVVGTLYMALLVARLVGLYQRQSGRRH